MLLYIYLWGDLENRHWPVAINSHGNSSGEFRGMVSMSCDVTSNAFEFRNAFKLQLAGNYSLSRVIVWLCTSLISTLYCTMLVTSTINPKYMAELPVVIISYKDAQCLVAVSKTYEVHLEAMCWWSLSLTVFNLQGMRDVVKNAFEIDESTNIILKTSTLDICQGRTVNIHESAWESVRLLVAEILVCIVENKGEQYCCCILEGDSEILSKKVLVLMRPFGQIPYCPIPLRGQICHERIAFKPISQKFHPLSLWRDMQRKEILLRTTK